MDGFYLQGYASQKGHYRTIRSQEMARKGKTTTGPTEQYGQGRLLNSTSRRTINPIHLPTCGTRWGYNLLGQRVHPQRMSHVYRGTGRQNRSVSDLLTRLCPRVFCPAVSRHNTVSLALSPLSAARAGTAKVWQLIILYTSGRTSKIRKIILIYSAQRSFAPHRRTTHPHYPHSQRPAD